MQQLRDDTGDLNGDMMNMDQDPLCVVCDWIQIHSGVHSHCCISYL